MLAKLCRNLVRLEVVRLAGRARRCCAKSSSAFLSSWNAQNAQNHNRRDEDRKPDDDGRDHTIFAEGAAMHRVVVLAQSAPRRVPPPRLRSKTSPCLPPTHASSVAHALTMLYILSDLQKPGLRMKRVKTLPFRCSRAGRPIRSRESPTSASLASQKWPETR